MMQDGCFPRLDGRLLRRWLLSRLPPSHTPGACLPESQRLPAPPGTQHAEWEALTSPRPLLCFLRRIFCIINPLMKKGRENP